ncbi:hypothetical protein M0802_013326 [Mischocyttarus mexicanus]|nr:hypothetical protein M0802_013332 [Mischocyttarus mexicanus]KAI4483501.1 hypothetical protein M0802_013326 [Mischocyttarus mexicanus]
MVRDNLDNSQVEKIHYLCTSLEGDAAKVILIAQSGLQHCLVIFKCPRGRKLPSGALGPDYGAPSVKRKAAVISAAKQPVAKQPAAKNQQMQ